jgi:hypothetical protein
MDESIYGNVGGGCGISGNIDEYISFELGNIQVAAIYPNHSFQIGTSSACGENSFATGLLCTASGASSTCHGTCCVASGTSSSSFGISNKSLGLATQTSGIECTASGKSSYVSGELASDNGYENSFVWGDSNGITVPTAPNQFTVKASNGVRFIVNGNNTCVTDDIVIETSGTSWKYQTEAPECWANQPPVSISEAIDRLAKAYSKQKGQIP